MHNKIPFFYFTVKGKHFEWQLSNGHQWMPIENDHVIETHYCQPGAKGITINIGDRSVLLFFSLVAEMIKKRNNILIQYLDG